MTSEDYPAATVQTGPNNWGTFQGHFPANGGHGCLVCCSGNSWLGW